MRKPLTLLLLAILLLSLAPVGAARAADEALPTDPALITGHLPNGLAYIIRPHKNPPHRVSIWLHVAAGSLDETDATQGLAHFLEHMAFNGSKNFPPGSVVPFFQSLGLSFGRDQNAFTSFDQTTYQLALPSADRAMLDKGMLFMADVATRLTLDPATIEAERPVILEEKRARASAHQRVEEEIYARIAPESSLGRRLPIGTVPTIKSVTAADFHDYYARWYVPSNMTVIIVGDVDPAVALDVLTQQFGGASRVPRPAPVDIGVKASAGPRAIVVTDRELTRADVGITRLAPPREPITTVARRRRELVEVIGAWAFNRRLSAEVAAGRVAFLDGRAVIDDWPHTLRMTAVRASGRPGTWRAVLKDLGFALQRARLHGFSEREVQNARAAFLADAEEAVRQEATRPAREVLRDLNRAVSRESPPMSAAQRLALLQRLLPGITPAEVSDAFAVNFDPAHAIFIAELPADDGVPAEADLLALGRAAVSVTPDKPLDVAQATTLLPTLPKPGVVVESVTHPASGVTSMWLDNGVRLHQRSMDQRKNEATITITLAGGTLEETAANRGITEAALRAWDRPATSTLSSTDIRDLMLGAKVRLRSGMSGDTVSLTVSGDPVDLERGLQLAYLLLTDPVIEPAALEQWKDVEAQRIEERKSQPMQALMETSAAALSPPNETRTRSLTTAQLQAITRPAAQAWLHRLITTAPIEVAAVGDLDRETATRLVTRYVGALPARPRISDKTLFNLRALTRPTGPIRVETSLEALTPQGAVMSGFYGADLRNLSDTRRLNLAARVLSTRMLKIIRQQKGLVYSIRAASEPAVVYPGFGAFVAVAPTEPGKAAALASAVDEMYAEFAKDGPTDEELAVAKRQTANLLDEIMRTPDFWLSSLASLDYRGLTLDDLLAAPGQYAGFTAAEIRDAFARYDRPQARFVFIVTPKS